MAEYEGMDEASLQQKLEAATSYDERSAIRQALRQLKKERGEQIGGARKGQSGYNRFVATKPVGKPSPKNYVHLDTSAEHSAVATATSPTSPTHAAAKKKDVVGVRASASPSPQTLGTESSATVTEKDSTVTRRSDPRSPPIVTESRDDEAEDMGVRTLSPPPPLSPGNVPRGSSGIPYKEECERKSTRNGACKEEEGNVGGMEEMNVKEESVIKKNDEDSLREGLVEEVEGLVEEEKEELNEESKEEEEEEEEGEEKSENVAEIKTERPLDEPDIASVVASKTQQPPSQKNTPGPKLEKSLDAPKNSRNERKDTPKDTKFDFGVKLKRPKSPTEKTTPTEKKTTPTTTDSIPSWRENKSTGREEGRLGGDSSPRLRAQTVAARPQKDTPTSSGGGGPRTLRDFQELAAKAKAKKIEEAKPTKPLQSTQLYAYLNAYVAKELSLPADGTSLYDVCSSAANLCKLINKSVPNTVDLRALTQISSTANKRARDEAEQENMTLVTESARAIGCHISDLTGDKILHKDPETIRNLLVELIRARVVNMPGMDEEPASVFQDMAALFEKLGVKVAEEPSTFSDAVDGGISEGDPEEEKQEKAISSSNDSWRDRHLREEEALPRQPPKTWREPLVSSSDVGNEDKGEPQTDGNLSYEERAARRAAARAAAQGNVETVPEHKEKQRDVAEKSDKKDPRINDALTYEERAALRRAERERRLKEREALATAK